MVVRQIFEREGELFDESMIILSKVTIWKSALSN